MDHEEIRQHTEEMEWIRRHEADELVEALMEQYGSDLKKLAFSYVKDWGKAEDISQDVFVICYKKIKMFRGDSALKTWLYRITVNRCKDWMKSWPFRHIRVGWPKFMREKVGISPSPEGEFLRRNENQLLADKVMALPLKYKEVIVLHYYSGLKSEEIGESLGQNVKTVRTRLRRARGLLRKMYEEEAEGNGR
ncbi:MAG TPA: sigma-70 family RNA polymerase sigma factor [Bacillales bacterium]|nr:sigma-70 family RNA polymerase sigma factor [Bacillales bacterium]